MYLQDIEIIIEKYYGIEWNNSRGSQKTTSTFLILDNIVLVINSLTLKLDD